MAATTINVGIDKFSSELQGLINRGATILERYRDLPKNLTPTFQGAFIQIEEECERWKSESQEFLKVRFVNSENDYVSQFKHAGGAGRSVLAASQGHYPGDLGFRFEFFEEKLQAKLGVLEKIDAASKFFEVDAEASSMKTTNMDTGTSQKVNRVFISHSSKDKEIVRQLIALLILIGVPRDRIFCTSINGYGAPLGDDFLETIKFTIKDDTLVLFVLSENFYASKISLCEMGAAWVLAKKSIPVVVPPFTFEQIEGVLPKTKTGIKINDKGGLNNLREELPKLLIGIEVPHTDIWEEGRDEIIEKMDHLLL